MPQSGQQQVKALQKDLACPNCEYNLRGLYGDIVNCPECGLKCDVVNLLSRQWTGPWHKAPGFTDLAYPLVWMLISMVLIVVAANIFHLVNDYLTLAVCGIMFLIAAGGWFKQLLDIHNNQSGMKGVGMSLLLHVVLVCYAFSVIGFLGSSLSFLGMFIYLVTAGIDLESLGIAAAQLGVVVITFFMVLLCRFGEKLIAKYCIRKYINQQPVN